MLFRLKWLFAGRFDLRISFRQGLMRGSSAEPTRIENLNASR